MKKLTALSVFIILLLAACSSPEPSPEQAGTAPFHAYFPIAFKPPVTVSLDMHILHIDARMLELDMLHIDTLRLHLGSAVDPDRTFWQLYKNGGWDSLDYLMTRALINVNELGARPIIMHQIGGACEQKPRSELGPYADFVAEFANRYGLERTEILNEPDATWKLGGLPSLFGCGQSPEDLVWMIERAKAQTGAQIGASFMLNSPGMEDYVSKVAPHLDFAGVHVYLDRDCNLRKNVPIWPGGIDQSLAIVNKYATGQVFLSEVNLRIGNCTDIQDFQEEQSDFLFYVIANYDSPVIFSYNTFASSWMGTGIRNTVFHNNLLGGTQ